MTCKPQITPEFCGCMLADSTDLAAAFKRYPVNASVIEGQLAVVETVARLGERPDQTPFLLSFATLAQQYPKHAIAIATYEALTALRLFFPLKSVHRHTSHHFSFWGEFDCW